MAIICGARVSMVFGSVVAAKLKAIRLLCRGDTVKGFTAARFGLANFTLMGGTIIGMMVAFFSCANCGANGLSAGSEGGVGSDKVCMFADDCETGACGVGITADAGGGAGKVILVTLIPDSSRSTSTFGAALSDACSGDGRSGIAATGSAAILSI